MVFSSDFSVGSESDVEIAGTKATDRGCPEEEDMACHEEDPAVESGVDGGATVTEELHPQGCEQGSGASAPPVTAGMGSAAAGP